MTGRDKQTKMIRAIAKALMEIDDDSSGAFSTDLQTLMSLGESGAVQQNTINWAIEVLEDSVADMVVNPE